ncbi:ATP-binding protein [Marinicellulosiphila megalodicopiae]|uniref:ATP-binding protein n=1 Tax=Marinicellulosiphila megalodicopiae TaxID=2724896 RepID=UPI003BB1C1DD
MNMVILTPVWLGMLLLSAIYVSFTLLRWMKGQSHIGVSIGMFCMGLTLIGLIPVKALQMGMYLFSENPFSINHNQICIQFYLSLSTMVAGWLSYREYYLGESVRMHPNTLKLFYCVMVSLLMLVLIFIPDNSQFVPSHFVYFLYLGLPAIILGIAAYLFHQSKTTLYIEFSLFSLAIAATFIGNWVFSTTDFIDYIMFESAAVVVLCWFLLKETKYFNDSQVVSFIGRIWKKPKLKVLMFHPHVLAFFAISLFSASLILIAAYLPTKQAMEKVQLNQIDHQSMVIVNEIQSTITHNQLFLDAMLNDKTGHAANNILNDIDNEYFSILYNDSEQDTVFISIDQGILYGNLLIPNVENKVFRFKITINQHFDNERVYLNLNQRHIYELKNTQWVKNDNTNGYSEKRQYFFKNAVLTMSFDPINWVNYIEITPPILFLFFSMLIVIYFLIVFKYSAIIHSIKYMTETLKSSPMDKNQSSMPIHDKNEFGELARAIKSMQMLVKEHNINLQQELLIKNELSDELIQAKEIAETANQSKTDFLATMSHELRTPMNGVIGIAQILAKSNLDKIQQKHVETIVKSSEMLLMILNDVLDISKIESKTLSLETHPINIKLILLQTVEVFYLEAKSKKLELLVNFKQDFNFEFSGDELRIKQIISNLLSNAIKFTNEGYIFIEVDVDVENKQVIVAVNDSGIGIDKDKVGTIFDNFVQEDSSSTRKVGGMGLGLSICKKLVDLMRGSIRAKTSEFGSRFELRLPFTNNFIVRNNEIWDEKKSILIVKSEFKGAEVYKEYLNNGKNHIDFYSKICRGNKVDWRNIAKDLLELEEINKYDLIIIDFGFVQSYLDRFYTELKIDKSLKILPILLIKDDSLDSNFLYNQYNIHSLNKPVYQHNLVVQAINVIKKLSPVSDTDIYKSNNKNKVKFNAKILVAEDTFLNQIIVKEFLLQLGFSVTVMENGKLALDELIENDYDLILMDCLMPEMDGYEATKNIRELSDPTKKTIPIIALTANALSDARKQCLDSGMNDFLSKPFVEKNLIEVLKKWLPNLYVNYSDNAEVNPLNADVINNDESEFLSQNPVVYEKLIHFKKLMGDMKYKAFIKKAIEEIPKYLYMLIDANKNNNQEEMIRAAHTLKSIASNFSFLKMSIFTQDLENDLRVNTALKPDEKIKALNDYCYELVQMLQEEVL